MMIMMMVCCAVCDEGRYGLNCSGVCDCADGSTCDPVTGGCRCGLGRAGARCELACDGQHYGQNCSERCECGQHARSCDAVTGCCRCLPGWYGPRCQHGMSHGLSHFSEQQSVRRNVCSSALLKNASVTRYQMNLHVQHLKVKNLKL